jgi:L-ascorbate metabolism protein UlaG (beta-lactamase superfamily)
MHRLNRVFTICALLLGVQIATLAHAQSVKLEQDPACQTLKPASTGGPLPRNPNILALRYLSYGNYELAYRGKVLLFDAFYDNARSPLAEPVGLKAPDVTRADAIFVGHTHLDHYFDAPAIAKRTGASVYLAPPGLPYVESQGLSAGQTKVVRGGETFKLKGYTVDTVLGIHMASDPAAWGAYRDFISKTTLATEEQKKQVTAYIDDLTSRILKNEDPLNPDQDTAHHGTIVYVVTFDDGFRLVYSDTAGVLSGGERVFADALHARGGKVDLAILGYLDSGFSVPRAIRTAVTKVKTWQPSIFLPSHHHDGDLLYGWPMPEMPTAPLFEAFRNQGLKTRGIEPLYRSPICVNTKTDEFFVGNYVQ